MEIRHLYIWTL